MVCVGNVTLDPESVPLSPFSIRLLWPFDSNSFREIAGDMVYHDYLFLKDHLPDLTKCEWFARTIFTVPGRSVNNAGRPEIDISSAQLLPLTTSTPTKLSPVYQLFKEQVRDPVDKCQIFGSFARAIPST